MRASAGREWQVNKHREYHDSMWIWRGMLIPVESGAERKIERMKPDLGDAQSWTCSGLSSRLSAISTTTVAPLPSI
ncbi:hypothetical protein PM082_009305 [Marasmius tenuissimus]|nr:hypothetical protein PM082_009305 [Marasmius tenuissimus]